MFTSRADGRDRHTSLVALLILLTLLPAACVLWFMNEAVQVQTEARRRTALEGYRVQLRLVRSRVEARWDAQAAQLKGFIGKEISIKVDEVACAQDAGQMSEAVVTKWSVVTKH